MITKNQIFTKLKTALNTSPLSVYCTQAYEPIAKSLPCMYFRETHFRPESTTNLKFTDSIRNSTVYIEVYAESGIDAIVSAIESTMSSCYYIEEMCSQIDNADPMIERYTMRFGRIIGEGDTLPS